MGIHAEHIYRQLAWASLDNAHLKLIKDIISKVLASRVSGHHLGTQTFKKNLSGHPKLFEKNFLQCQFQAYN